MIFLNLLVLLYAYECLAYMCVCMCTMCVLAEVRRGHQTYHMGFGSWWCQSPTGVTVFVSHHVDWELNPGSLQERKCS